MVSQEVRTVAVRCVDVPNRQLINEVLPQLLDVVGLIHSKIQ